MSTRPRDTLSPWVTQMMLLGRVLLAVLPAQISLCLVKALWKGVTSLEFLSYSDCTAIRMFTYMRKLGQHGRWREAVTDKPLNPASWS